MTILMIILAILMIARNLVLQVVVCVTFSLFIDQIGIELFISCWFNFRNKFIKQTFSTYTSEKDVVYNYIKCN